MGVTSKFSGASAWPEETTVGMAFCNRNSLDAKPFFHISQFEKQSFSKCLLQTRALRFKELKQSTPAKSAQAERAVSSVGN